MSSKTTSNKKAELFRRASSAAKASQHRQPLQRGFSKDLILCDEGRELDLTSSRVQSDDSDPEVVEQKGDQEDGCLALRMEKGETIDDLFKDEPGFVLLHHHALEEFLAFLDARDRRISRAEALSQGFRVQVAAGHIVQH